MKIDQAVNDYFLCLCVPGVLVLKSLNLEHLDILSYKLYLVCPRLLVYTVNSRGHGKGRTVNRVSMLWPIHTSCISSSKGVDRESGRLLHANLGGVVQAVTDSETARTTPSLSILILFPSPSLWISRVRRRVREGKVLRVLLSGHRLPCNQGLLNPQPDNETRFKVFRN